MELRGRAHHSTSTTTTLSHIGSSAKSLANFTSPVHARQWPLRHKSQLAGLSQTSKAARKRVIQNHIASVGKEDVYSSRVRLHDRFGLSIPMNTLETCVIKACIPTKQRHVPRFCYDKTPMCRMLGSTRPHHRYTPQHLRGGVGSHDLRPPYDHSKFLFWGCRMRPASFCRPSEKHCASFRNKACDHLPRIALARCGVWWM